MARPNYTRVVTPPPRPRPDSHWGWVAAAWFMFLPLAIVATIHAVKVDSSWTAGDYEGARRASADAQRYGRLGVIVGGSLIGLTVLLYCLYILVVVLLLRSLW